MKDRKIAFLKTQRGGTNVFSLMECASVISGSMASVRLLKKKKEHVNMHRKKRLTTSTNL